VTGFDIPFPYFQVEQHALPEADDIIEAVTDAMAWD
jgi:pyruvate/2-oxoglutarate/acetoin dehydrogenase E1 component